MRVLFATDGAEPSERAGELLTRIADPTRTRILVLSVNDFDVAMRQAQRSGRYSTEAGHEAARRAVEAGLEQLRQAGLAELDGRVEDGDEASEIVHAAETERFDLVTVGAGPRDRFDIVSLGSVSSSVLYAAPCPVLVVRQAPEPGPTVRVLVGSDGSVGSNHAIASFIALADPSRCEVAVVTAVPPLGADEGPDVAGDALVLAHRHAEAATDDLVDAGFRVEAEVVTGRAAPVLLDQVERRGADLVVVGARGLGRFESKMLGSVSDLIVRGSRATLVGR